MGAGETTTDVAIKTLAEGRVDIADPTDEGTADRRLAGLCDRLKVVRITRVLGDLTDHIHD